MRDVNGKNHFDLWLLHQLWRLPALQGLHGHALALNLQETSISCQRSWRTKPKSSRKTACKCYQLLTLGSGGDSTTGSFHVTGYPYAPLGPFATLFCGIGGADWLSICSVSQSFDETHSLNLNRVNELLERPESTGYRRRTSEGTATPPLLELNEQDEIALQIALYDLLRRYGGRGPFPPSEFRQVMKDRSKYLEILSYWDQEGRDWKVQGHHVEDWIQFREHQRRMRERGSFAAYASQVQALLLEESFKKDVHLHEDPGEQDDLTTWAEYLALKYGVQHAHLRAATKGQRLLEQEWKRMQDAGILRPSDTPSSLSDSRAVAAEERQVQTSTRALRAAEATLHASQARQHTGAHIESLKLKVEELRQSLDVSLRRSSVIRRYCWLSKDVTESANEAERLGKFIRWMLQQVPMIEEEMQHVPRANQATMTPYRNPVWPESTTVFGPSGHSPWAEEVIAERVSYLEARLRGEDADALAYESDGTADALVESQATLFGHGVAPGKSTEPEKGAHLTADSAIPSDKAAGSNKKSPAACDAGVSQPPTLPLRDLDLEKVGGAPAAERRDGVGGAACSIAGADPGPGRAPSPMVPTRSREDAHHTEAPRPPAAEHEKDKSEKTRFRWLRVGWYIPGRVLSFAMYCVRRLDSTWKSVLERIGRIRRPSARSVKGVNKRTCDEEHGYN